MSKEMSLTYKMASHEAVQVIRIDFTEPFDFVADSLYSGVKRKYRAESLVVTYVDDQAHTWKMSANQVKADNSLSSRAAGEYDGRYGMDKDDVSKLNEIAKKLDPRKESE